MDSMWVRILGLVFSRGHLNPKPFTLWVKVVRFLEFTWATG